jgi:hypothetical protein
LDVPARIAQERVPTARLCCYFARRNWTVLEVS